MRKNPLIVELVSCFQARENCRKSGNKEWEAKHTNHIHQLTALLPSGSGVDNGTKIIDVSEDSVNLQVAFHHMNDVGFYDGWTDHIITVCPGWAGIRLTISGEDRNDIKDHLTELYYTMLSSPVYYDEDTSLWHFASEE